MKKAIVKIAVGIVLALALVLTASAHSGRTDSKGGHKDNKNASGLGSYHFHCGGNPAHLHNGGCPYAASTPSTPAKQPASPKAPSADEALGDVVYTDIKAYINGNPIPVSNINGQAHIVVEDLQKYGFDVVWNAKANTLKAERNKTKEIQPLPVEKIPAGKKAGDVRAQYVSSAVKVYLSGELIDAYSINGSMFMDFELLSKYGTVTWDASARTLNCKLK